MTSPDLGIQEGSEVRSAKASVVTGDSLVQGEVVLFDSSRDNVGPPDFQIMAQGFSIRQTGAADVYLRDYDLELPEDFKEPPPYSLNAQEWEVYSKRKARIEKRFQDALAGTNFG